MKVGLSPLARFAQIPFESPTRTDVASKAQEMRSFAAAEAVLASGIVHADSTFGTVSVVVRCTDRRSRRPGGLWRRSNLRQDAWIRQHPGASQSCDTSLADFKRQFTVDCGSVLADSTLTRHLAFCSSTMGLCECVPTRTSSVTADALGRCPIPVSFHQEPSGQPGCLHLSGMAPGIISCPLLPTILPITYSTHTIRRLNTRLALVAAQTLSTPIEHTRRSHWSTSSTSIPCRQRRNSRPD